VKLHGTGVKILIALPYSNASSYNIYFSFQVSVSMNIISYAGDMLIQDELLLVSAQYEAGTDLSILAKN
jgi:hypothetical protein